MKSVLCFSVAAFFALASIEAQIIFPDELPKTEKRYSSNSKMIEAICTVQEEDDRQTKNKPGETNEESCINGTRKEFGPGDRGDTTDIWHAVREASLPAVIFWVNLDQNNTNIKDGNNWTILMSTSEYGHLEIVKYLVSRGAEVDALDAIGQTALMVASTWGHTSTLKYLIEKGANLNTQDKWKQTALHDAVQKDHLDIVKILTRNGADKNLRDESGRTPLERAKFEGRTSIVEFLSSN